MVIGLNLGDYPTLQSTYIRLQLAYGQAGSVAVLVIRSRAVVCRGLVVLIAATEIGGKINDSNGRHPIMNTNINRKVTGGLLGFAALLAAGLANAATVSVVTSASSVAPGGTFTATIVADLTDVGGFTDGGFDLSWDTSVLSLVPGSNGVAAELQTAFDDFDTLHPGYTPFPAHSNTVLDETPPTALLQFILTNCGLGLFDAKCETIGATQAIDLYELTFQISDTAAVDVARPSLLGAEWLLAGPNAELNPNDPTFPTYIGATVNVNPVPVPPAVWLFGSGLLGLISVARRRQSQS